jgi:hypothetical protein
MAKSTHTKLNAAAEKVGSTLGHLAARAADLDKQRHQIADQIRKTIAQGHALLERLGHKEPPPPALKHKGNAKGFRASAATKAAVRKTWKDDDLAKGPAEHTKPDDVRATIRATESRRWTNRQAGKG